MGKGGSNEIQETEAQQATASRNARMGLGTSSNANDNSQVLRAAIMED